MTRLILGAALLATLTIPAAARGATYQATVSPASFSFSDGEPVSYRLQITTGGQAETLEIRAQPPLLLGGGTLMRLEEMTLEGPGTVLFSNVLSSHGDPICTTPLLPDGHASNYSERPRMQVEIPPNSTSVVVLPARPRAFGPLWPGVSLAVDFEAGAPEATPQLVRSPSPENSGLHGVPISFQTVPRGGPGGCPDRSRPPVVPFGRDVLMGGKVFGPVAGQLMTIRFAREGDRTPRDLATVRIDADGVFRYRWRPSVPDGYALGALYRSQSPGLADDFAPATTVRIAPPITRVRPTAVTATRSIRCRGRRCTLRVRGSVRRPAGASAGCAGSVRIRVAAGTRRLLSTRASVRSTCRYTATRRFRLGSRRTRTVLVRVSYLGAASLLPRTGRAVRVKIRRAP